MEHQNGKRECSFTPEISSNSRRLVKRRENSKDCQKVEDRLIGYINRGRHDRELDKTQASDMHQEYACKTRESKRPTADDSVYDIRLSAANNQPPEHENKLRSQICEHIDTDHEHLDQSKDDNDKDLNFSFRKLQNSLEKICIKESSPYHTEKHLNFGSKVDNSIEETENDNISSQDRDYEIERYRILALRKVELKKRKEEAMSRDAKAKPIPQKDLTFTQLKKATHTGRSVSISQTVKPAQVNQPPRTLKQPATQKPRDIISSQPSVKNQSKHSENRQPSTRRPLISESVSMVSTSRINDAQTVIEHARHDQSVDRHTFANPKMNRTEIAEKYGAKVKKASIDCSDIRESVFAGDTTSMMQNLKKLNSNLRKCSNLECIIKKKPISKTYLDKSQSKQGLIQQVDLGKENWYSPSDIPTKNSSISQKPDRNPFLELANAACQRVFN